MKKIILAALFSIIGLIAAVAVLIIDREESYFPEDAKVIHIARSTDPRSLDPVGQFDTASGMFVEALYDRLLEYRYFDRPYELKPSLIKEMPEVSEDGLIYKFTLRKGVFFSDNPCFDKSKGRELIAQDALYSIKRFADIKQNTQSYFLLDGAIKGLDEYHKLSRESSTIDHLQDSIEGLKLIDRYSFEVHLTQKSPIFLYALASAALSVVPHEAVRFYKDRFKRNPVGTGAFRLKKYRKKQTLVLTKNPNYFQTYPKDNKAGKADFVESAGKQLPLVDGVQISFMPEAQPRMLKFKAGELSLVGLDRDNFMQLAHRTESGEFKLNKELEDKYSLLSEPDLNMQYISFNLKDKTLQNKNLRKAIVHAVDVNKQIELLLNGRGSKLSTVVPLDIYGSEKQIGNHWYSYSLKTAKEYMSEAGFDDKPLTLTLTVGGTSVVHHNIFEFYRESFDQIGIELLPDYLTWTAFLKATDRGDFQLATAGWAADYPDAENFYQLFYGPNVAPIGQNSGHFANAEYDQLYEQMRFMPNSNKRLKIMGRMAEILKEEVPIVLTYNSLSTGLKQRWVKNYSPNSMMNGVIRFIDIDNKLFTLSQRSP